MTARSTHVPSLDGLRLACCLAVIVGHAAWGPMAGRLASFGVDVFFALSGYLITSLLLRERARAGSVDLSAFYVRRALRILPAYYASIAVAFGLTYALGDRFVASFHGPNDARFFTTTLASYAAFIGNWSDAPVPSVVAVLWSVCIEEQFYLFFPPTFARSTRRLPVLAPVLIGLAIAWACRMYYASIGDTELYRSTLAHADGLLLGALLAQIVDAGGGRVRALVANNALTAEAIAFGASIALFVFRGGSSPFAYWASFFASAICATAIVAAIALGRGPIARFFAKKPLAWLGTLTYAGYLVHMYGVTAAFGVTRRVAFGAAEIPIRIGISIALTFAIAYVAHVAIERPFLRLKAKYNRRSGALDSPASLSASS